MNEHLSQVSATARNAAFKQDWATVNICARELIDQDASSPEGHFLHGLVMKAANQPVQAIAAFDKALALDANRHDAAIELANLHCAAQRHPEAAALVDKYVADLANSPLYLHLAGTVYSRVGLPDRAWPLFERANELQPGVALFEASLGTCAMFLGKIEEAKQVYRGLLERAPAHQRHHYQLAMLDKATDTTHVEQMTDILRSSTSPADRNIYLYYAIGKELEDLGQWAEAFTYFKRAGDAVMRVADYSIEKDIALIDRIIGVCDRSWLADEADQARKHQAGKTPIFIVGLPRSGTTLTDRIVSSHSEVVSVDETQYMPMAIRRASGIHSEEKMTPDMIEAAAKLDIGEIGDGYLANLSHRLGDEPMFVDKLPFNILYLGFICKAFPDARIIHMTRNPMDACFAMYKQVFVGTYKFSYSLENLGRFYVAYSRLVDHWKRTLGDRLIELRYEDLVTDQERQTRRLLDSLGLSFEDACLEFDKNRSATATASSVQVREKIHTQSVYRWRHYEEQLQPLTAYLEDAGIGTDGPAVVS